MLIPLWHHAERAKVPAAKSVPVRIVKDGSAAAEDPDEAPVSSDFVSGRPLSDAAVDLTRAAGVTGRIALHRLRREPFKTVVFAVAAGLLIGAAQAWRGDRQQR